MSSPSEQATGDAVQKDAHTTILQRTSTVSAVVLLVPGPQSWSTLPTLLPWDRHLTLAWHRVPWAALQDRLPTALGRRHLVLVRPLLNLHLPLNTVCLLGWVPLALDSLKWEA